MAHILVVDDETGLRQSMALFLQREGHTTSTAANLANAREQFNGTPIDVTVTDLVMPDGNGIELLAWIRENSPRTKVLIVTGHPTIETAAEAVRNGAFDYLAKPVSRDALIRVTGNAVRFQEMEDENRAYQKNLEALVAQRTERLTLVLGQTVQALGSALETRDPYTAGHQRRVTDLAEAIGRGMGLDQDRMEGLRMAGLLHDIGKLQVPSELLSKPTRLTRVEFDIIKTHSEAGYQILKRIDFPWPVATFVRQHHERLDGSGYPDGLSAPDILLESRILAVSDVVEAMATHRPYRPSLGVDLALKTVQEGINTHFDPKVVDACASLFHSKSFQWSDQDTA
jgi:putative two-component system response regulator